MDVIAFQPNIREFRRHYLLGLTHSGNLEIINRVGNAYGTPTKEFEINDFAAMRTF